jgi:GMP synthase-like glutamine amidotransferase
MRIFCLRHVPFESAGVIEQWAVNRNHPFFYVNLYENAPFPRPEHFDLLVILGGPMNVYEEDRYPWLKDEKSFLVQAVESGKKMLGICLGAQLLADVLGGEVFSNPYREIGWHPVRLGPGSEESPLVRRVFPPQFLTFQWHGDTFVPPAGSVLWATNEACANQAFQYGRDIVGLQFHLEYTVEIIEKMLYFCSDDLTEGPFIQTVQRIRADYPHIGAMNQLMIHFLDEWTQNR